MTRISFRDLIIHVSDIILNIKLHFRLAELRDKFQKYDTDKNGFVSLNEAQWALQLELDITQPTALRLLNQFVKLDYEHFVEFYGQIQKK